jgi:hypothetical protein
MFITKLVRVLLGIVLAVVFEILWFVLNFVATLVVGVIEAVSERLVKPVLVAWHNHLLQPYAVMIMEVFTLFKRVAKPFFEAFEPLFTLFGGCFRECKCIAINYGASGKPAPTVNLEAVVTDGPEPTP